MASIVSRQRKDDTIAYRLRWRFGGRRGGPTQSVTYDFLDDAKKMRGAVEARGHLVYAADPAVQDFSLVTGMRQHTYTAPTFGEVAEAYVASRTRASSRSRDRYRHTLEARLSALTPLPIEAIADDDIRDVINDITAAGGSPIAVYELACSVFKYATNKGLLPHGNPATQVDPPRRRGRVGVFLTPTEAVLLLDECASLSGALADLVDGILGTGLRISEALGLVVADVHADEFDAAWIDVQEQLYRPTKADPSPRRVPLKTDASRRRIALDAQTAAIFARLIKDKRPNVPVFDDPDRGGWWTQSRVSTVWSEARSIACEHGLTKVPRIHDLRHTHAAWLITDGVPLLAVSRRLGHESIKITADTYGHLLPEADDAIRGALMLRRTAMSARRSQRVSRTSTTERKRG